MNVLLYDSDPYWSFLQHLKRQLKEHDIVARPLFYTPPHFCVEATYFNGLKPAAIKFAELIGSKF